MLPGSSGGRSRDASTAPFFFHIEVHQRKGCEMIFDWNRTPALHVSQLLREASAKTGFTVADIEALVDSELETLHLLEYITAVLTKRMN
jgi:hypothetical protein